MLKSIHLFGQRDYVFFAEHNFRFVSSSFGSAELTDLPPLGGGGALVFIPGLFLQASVYSDSDHRSDQTAQAGHGAEGAIYRHHQGSGNRLPLLQRRRRGSTAAGDDDRRS